MASHRLVAQNERKFSKVVYVGNFAIGIRNLDSGACQQLQRILNKDPSGELAQSLRVAGQMSRSRKAGHGYSWVGRTGILVPQSDWDDEIPGTSNELVPLSEAALAQLSLCRGMRTLESSSSRSHHHMGFEIPVVEVKGAFRTGAIQFEHGDPLTFPLHMIMCEGGHWEREDDEEVVLTDWPDWDAGERFLVGHHEEEGEESRILVLEPAKEPGDWIAYAIQERPSFQVWSGVDHSVIPPRPYRNDRISIRSFPVGNTLTGWTIIPVRFHRTS